MRPIIKITSTKFDEIIYNIKEKIEKICYKLSKEKREELRKILHLNALKLGPIRDMSIELTIPPDFSKYDK